MNSLIMLLMSPTDRAICDIDAILLQICHTYARWTERERAFSNPSTVHIFRI